MVRNAKTILGKSKRISFKRAVILVATIAISAPVLAATVNLIYLMVYRVSPVSCSRVSFDKETGIATFLINIIQWNDQKIDGDKITFYFTEFLSNKSKFEGELTEDTRQGVAVSYIPKTLLA